MRTYLDGPLPSSRHPPRFKCTRAVKRARLASQIVQKRLPSHALSRHSAVCEPRRPPPFQVQFLAPRRTGSLHTLSETRAPLEPCAPARSQARACARRRRMRGCRRQPRRRASPPWARARLPAEHKHTDQRLQCNAYSASCSPSLSLTHTQLSKMPHVLTPAPRPMPSHPHTAACLRIHELPHGGTTTFNSKIQASILAFACTPPFAIMRDRIDGPRDGVTTYTLLCSPQDHKQKSAVTTAAQQRSSPSRFPSSKQPPQQEHATTTSAAHAAAPPDVGGRGVADGGRGTYRCPRLGVDDDVVGEDGLGAQERVERQLRRRRVAARVSHQARAAHLVTIQLSQAVHRPRLQTTTQARAHNNSRVQDLDLRCAR
eukprot:5486251-Pleurochrysis_carterae.AAC.7